MMPCVDNPAAIPEGIHGRGGRMKRTIPPVTELLTSKLQRLREEIAGLRRVVVAFSGGVDSSLVLKVASEGLHDDAHGVLAVSPSLPQSEKEEAVALARTIGAKLE